MKNFDLKPKIVSTDQRFCLKPDKKIRILFCVSEEENFSSYFIETKTIVKDTATCCQILKERKK